MVANKRRDNRPIAVAAIVVAVFIGGALLSKAPDSWVVGDSKDYSDNAVKPTYLLDDEKNIIEAEPMISAIDDPEGHNNQQLEILTKQQFADAARLLQIGHFEQAITLFHKVLTRYPDLPEAHINLGYAMLGLDDLEKAAKSFAYALEIKPEAADAYYGLALVAEKEGDYEFALGAMRSYIHLRPDDKYVGKARAAVDYWVAELAKQKTKSNEKQVAVEDGKGNRE